MVRMQKNITKLKLVKNKLPLLLILLVGLSACDKGTPKFPDVHVWETAQDPRTKEMLCGEYRIKDGKKLTFEPVLDHNIKECRGVFGFKDKDFPTVLDWMDSVERYYKDKLKKCNSFP